MPRKIIHIDMDAFYAAVEQRDQPALRGRPVVVGGSPRSRGVVATASYEARRFGIHSAMPAAQAHRLCPEAVFLPPRFEAYRAASEQIGCIFLEVTERVEPLSLDEAYLDVTASPKYGGSATRIARRIKERIREDTGLTASAGVSYNKFLAKLASDLDKPDGLTVIRPADGPRFVEGLPIGQFFGIGPATEARMHGLGIRTGADLRARSLPELRRHFGKLADWYYDLARGRDERPVMAHRRRKSLGSETTFATDLTAIPAMVAVLDSLADEVMEGLHLRALMARTLSVKVKFADFTLVTRSVTPGEALRHREQVVPWLPLLLARTDAGSRPVRLLGVTVSGLEPRTEDPAMVQLDLFGS
jgi:DNA polymerase-4